jgi:hypothetical protein
METGGTWKLSSTLSMAPSTSSHGTPGQARAGSAEETHVACHGYCKPRMVLDRRGEGERRMQFGNYCGLIKIARCGFPFLTSGRPMTSPVISSNREGGP